MKNQNVLLCAILVAALAGCTEAKPAAPSAPAPAANPPASAAASQPAASTLLTEGTAAPDFEAQAQDGSNIKLSAMKGKPVVVYFYPKDDTPGCTIEAKSFTAGIGDFKTLGVTVVGVSLDNMDSHKAFSDKYSLQFPIVPDPDAKIAKAFGVDTSHGYAKRVTFVIGP